MIDLQYICSGLLKIYLGSQEATCFYVNEETGLFAILFFFLSVSPDNVIEAGVPVKQHLNSPIPSQAGAGSLVTLAPLWLLARSSDPPTPLCTEIGGGQPVTAQLKNSVALDHCPAGIMCRGSFLPRGLRAQPGSRP